MVTCLDGVTVSSTIWENHVKYLDQVPYCIHKKNLNLKPYKFVQQVKYLEHVLGQGTTTPAELKVKAIQNFSGPISKTEIRAFLKLPGYYQ